MPLQSKFLAGYYDSPFIDRVDTGLGYLVAMDDDPDKAALYGGRGLQFPKTVMAGLWYLGFNWLDPVVGGGSTPEEAERASRAAPGDFHRGRLGGKYCHLPEKPRHAGTWTDSARSLWLAG